MVSSSIIQWLRFIIQDLVQEFLYAKLKVAESNDKRIQYGGKAKDVKEETKEPAVEKPKPGFFERIKTKIHKKEEPEDVTDFKEVEVKQEYEKKEVEQEKKGFLNHFSKR